MATSTFEAEALTFKHKAPPVS